MNGTPGGILSVFSGAVRYSELAINRREHFRFLCPTPLRNFSRALGQCSCLLRPCETACKISSWTMHRAAVRFEQSLYLRSLHFLFPLSPQFPAMRHNRLKLSF